MQVPAAGRGHEPDKPLPIQVAATESPYFRPNEHMPESTVLLLFYYYFYCFLKNWVTGNSPAL